MPLQLEPIRPALPSDSELARAVLLRLTEDRRVRALAASVAQQLATSARA